MNTAQKSKISNFGGVVALLSLASIILSFLNYNINFLKWFDFWGEKIGWLIRIGLIAIGLSLYFLLNEYEEHETTTEIHKKQPSKSNI